MLLDFSKAFDNINHEILLKKREFYGIRGIANQWFSSHLSNSLHSYSTVNGVTSIPVSHVIVHAVAVVSKTWGRGQSFFFKEWCFRVKFTCKSFQNEYLFRRLLRVFSGTAFSIKYL